MRHAALLFPLLAFLIAPAASAQQRARAQLANAAGEKVAEATLTETPHGVLIHLLVSNLPAGTHALHIHATGKCEPLGFDSAGGHYNPEGKKHGLMSGAGKHAGDLPNIHVPAGGALHVEVLAADVTLEAGSRASLFDTDGSALVIHASADDYATDPAGAAGPRIACGVVSQ